MSKVDVQKDLDTIKDGVLAFVEATSPRRQADDDGPKKKGAKQLAALEEAAMLEQLTNERLPVMIEAGFRLVGGLFVNMQRIADSIEDQAGAG